MADAVNDWENPAVFQRNRLKPRAYFFPETSLSLNGHWDFHCAPSPLLAPSAQSSDETVKAQEQKEEWNPIEVPGHWQLQGYGRPHYTNTIFPFPACPPHVPSENPTGSYRRTFWVPQTWDAETQLRLRFDGVDSAYYVWVNGVEVGYAQGSRNAAEFDVSHVVKRGEANEVWVRVLQWSDASYIEDQDQWWLSGIYRDVTLLAFPSVARIEDFRVHTDLDAQYRDAQLSVAVDLATTVAGSVAVTLFDVAPQNQRVVASKTTNITTGQESTQLTLAVPNPHKWTAESPTLYDLEITLSPSSSSQPIQTIKHRVGFRKVEMRNGNITVNGQAVLFRGVNRHDHHPRYGRAVPLDFLREDLLRMKRHNVNALRCCHYPSHPALYGLCDELGLWVMDEADLECHGFYDAVALPLGIPESVEYEERKKRTFGPAAQFTSNNPVWRAAYLDRAEQMLQRDKNHTCVIIWSLGNEAFYGQNHAAMYEYLKGADVQGRPVHYEGDWEAKTADMFSYMYPSVEKIERLAQAEGDTFAKPIVLCEYGHAMGNAPGALEEYMTAFRAHRRLQGGWIWEWANHGLWDEEKGWYGYGGDFGDVPNDGSFVMDGLCFSDHSPTPGLVELRKAYAPVQAWVEGGAIHVTNRHDFVALDGLQALYTVETLGDTTQHLTAGTLAIPHILPGETGQIKLPADLVPQRPATTNTKAETWLTVSFTTKHASTWSDANYEVAWFQHRLASSSSSSSSPIPSLSSLTLSSTPLSVDTTAATITIHSTAARLTFSRQTGSLTSWHVNNHPLLHSSSNINLKPGFWRPPTDNDVPHDLGVWRRFGLDALTIQLRQMTTSQLPTGAVQIVTKSFLSPPILDWGFHATMTYTVSPTGALTVSATLKPTGRMPEDLPRIGLDLDLTQTLDQVSWFGLGPGEAYPDKKRAQRVGIYRNSVEGLEAPYEVPQEGGNRMETRWLRLANGRGWGVKVSRVNEDGKEEDGLFSWLASRYSAEEIERAGHINELVKGESVKVRLDVAGCGVGTGACGPRTLDKYRVQCEETAFAFTLEPDWL